MERRDKSVSKKTINLQVELEEIKTNVSYKRVA